MSFQNKIIMGLIGIIFILFSVFQTYRLGVANKTIKTQDIQISSMIKQNQDNLQDLSKRNEEIINNQSKINDLQKKIKVKFKENDCINAIVPDEFLDMLQDNDSK